MSNPSGNPGTIPLRPIPLAPLYVFSFLFAAIAVVWFAWFLLAADELFKAINYRALVFGFVSFLALTLVFEFLRAFGLSLPSLPRFGVPVCMIVLWTVGL